MESPLFAKPVSCYDTGEADAPVQLAKLKADLKAVQNADSDTFWRRLMEGITTITQAQCSFVAKRELETDDTEGDGSPGGGAKDRQCFVGACYYYDNGHSPKMHRNYRDLSAEIPCCPLEYSKGTFVVPRNLGSYFGPELVSRLPFPMDAYFTVPMASFGECPTYFGLMWTREAISRLNISWSFLEIMIYSLEDIILTQIEQEANIHRGRHVEKLRALGTSLPELNQPKPECPAPKISAFEPFAPSLSHELRTPLHGMIANLEFIHRTVLDIIDNRLGERKSNELLGELIQNIEFVQDSAQRADQVAENVVLAYSLNMSCGSTPKSTDPELDDQYVQLSNTDSVDPVQMNVPEMSTSPGRNLAVIKSHSRAPSVPGLGTEAKTAVEETRDLVVQGQPEARAALIDEAQSVLASSSPPIRTFFPPMALPHASIRPLIRFVIDKSLVVGGRPAISEKTPTELGEELILQYGSNADRPLTKKISWSVAPDIPESIFLDEKDLAKVVSRVFMNALKFTESGVIELRATLENNFMLISIKDSGSGIDERFLPDIFSPFSREDFSTTRSNDGLGLGLLVAKGLSRKMGGDLNCTHSATSGLNQGSIFEIKLPIDLNYSSQLHRPSIAETNTGTPDTSVHSEVLDDEMKGIEQNNNQETTTSNQSGSIPSQNLPASRVEVDFSEDQQLARKYPLSFLVVDDNHINRIILMKLLKRFGYSEIQEAKGGKEAVRCVAESLGLVDHNGGIDQVSSLNKPTRVIDVIFMDIWMPEMDGYQATKEIQSLFEIANVAHPSSIVAVTADETISTRRRVFTYGMFDYIPRPFGVEVLKGAIAACYDQRTRIPKLWT